MSEPQRITFETSSMETAAILLEAARKAGFVASYVRTAIGPSRDRDDTPVKRMAEHLPASEEVGFTTFYDDLVGGRIIKESDGEPWPLMPKEAQQIVAHVRQLLSSALQKERERVLEDLAANHFRCKNCGKCVCQHSDKELKDLSPTLAEYQKHIRALAQGASHE